MRRILLASAAFSLLSASAFAADLSPEVPFKAPPSPPPFTWTGCYAGGQIGGGFGQKDLTDTAGVIGASPNLDISGYTIGGQIGCDYQFGSNLVLGVEGTAAGGDIGGKTSFATPGIPGDVTTFKDTTDFLSSATARVGYAWDRWLLYAKGGGAWVGDRNDVFDAAQNYAFEGWEMRFGWTAGAGIEWALRNDWSLKLEYDYYGLGTRGVTFIDNISGISAAENIKENIQVIKLGLNFHVWAGPLSSPLAW